MIHPLILNLETATNVCSVALCKGEETVAKRESDEDRSHGSLLTVFMQEVLDEAGVKPEEISAIAVSKGPGSYTGLRIGVSVTKGFAYGLNIPVIGIVTLQAMVVAATWHHSVKELQQKHPETLFCPMIDARRMEVFTALYDKNRDIVSPVTATVVGENSFDKELKGNHILFFGNGADKLSGIIQHPHAHFIQQIQPSAVAMIPLSLHQYENRIFEDTAYFEPYYLKDFVATIPRKKVI
ncbi:MAG: tRNA (adenosine(37)-N6)-threonylcarbamoyltransferase complex dimerization subunit type 1 TsaB [Bacteroidales bacterium]